MFSEKQLEILKFPYSKYDALICDGAIRSGKTSIMTISFILWAMNNFNNKRLAICGKTVDSAFKNIIAPLLSVKYMRDNFYLKFSKTQKTLEVTRGNKKNTFEIFGGKDESSFALIQGRTLAGVMLDEVALMPKSFVDQALARCSVSGSKFWFNCNPSSPQHWFYQEWILNAKSKNALYLKFKLQDNPSLDENIIKRYENMYSGVFYDRYILGEWVVAEGLVYQNFDKNRHLINFDKFLNAMSGLEKLHFENTAKYYISCDYGITNPFACYIWCVYDRVAYCIKEYYYDSRKTGYRKTDEEHYASVDAMVGDLVIEDFVIDPSANSFKEVIYRHDKYDILNANNNVLDGISNATTLLDSNHILIDENCSHFIEEFGLYRWDDKSPGDCVIKEFDHALDQFRYFVQSVLRIDFDWFDWSN